MTADSFNKTHPELLPGEVFITNISTSSMEALMMFLGCPFERHDPWDEIMWETKRRGSVAYDMYGNKLNWYHPVFIQRDEVIKAGKDPDNLWGGTL